MAAPILALVAASAASQPPVTPVPLSSLRWLAGCWSGAADGRTWEEQWMAPAGGMMIGMSRTIAGGKTVEYESVVIREDEKGIVYIANPSGQASAEFRLVRGSPIEVVFENLRHDFPQRIVYGVEGDDLRARIEGMVDGKLRTVGFPMKRMKCGG